MTSRKLGPSSSYPPAGNGGKGPTAGLTAHLVSQHAVPRSSLAEADTFEKLVDIHTDDHAGDDQVPDKISEIKDHSHSPYSPLLRGK